MHDHNITGMADAIRQRLDVDETGLTLEDVLREYWQDMIADVWDVTDVEAQAIETGVELTNEQCREVLQHMLNKFDANVGINWTVIDCTIDEIVKEAA